MFDERRGHYLWENIAGGGRNEGESVEDRLRNAVEKVVEVFQAVEGKYGKTFEEIIGYLEDHGYAASEILFHEQDKIDSDIYGRILAHTVSPEEVENWFSEVSEWEREVCQLVSEFERLYERSLEHAVMCC